MLRTSTVVLTVMMDSLEALQEKRILAAGANMPASLTLAKACLQQERLARRLRRPKKR